VNKCNQKHTAKGFCNNHYRLWCKYGDPEKRMVASSKHLKDFLREALKTETSKCILWPFSGPKGYGYITWKGKRVLAHRLVCLLSKGQPPTNKPHAAHYCGVKGCINKRHLRWASISENNLDKKDHGKDLNGKKHPGAKLDKKKVAYIRKSNETNKQLAERFKVSPTTIFNVRHKKTWKYE
jgi:hypothetical protein